MDIMDSSDTPQGGMNDRSTASTGVRAERDLPLSVDESENIGSPTHYRTDTNNVASGSSGLDLDRPDGLPTSTDDLPMHSTQHVTPSVSATLGSIKNKVNEAVEEVEDKIHSATAKLHQSSTSSSSPSTSSSYSAPSLNIGNSDMPIPRPDDVLDTDVSNPDPDPGMAWSGNHTGTAQRIGDAPHPLISNTRDAHLSGGLVSLPTHANERQPHSAGERRETDNERRAVERAAAVTVEPKDQTAEGGGGGGLSGMLNSMSEKVGSGVSMIREKVDDWAEQHMRSSPTPSDGQVPSQAPPTMINKNDPYMTEVVHARSQQGK